MILKASSTITIPIGPFVGNSDGYTAQTSLTIPQGDVRISKNGGSFAQKTDSSNAASMENGWYSVIIEGADVDTLGPWVMAVTATGALPVWVRGQVVPATSYNSLFAGTDYLKVDAEQISGSAAASLTSAMTYIASIDAAVGSIDSAVATYVASIDTVVGSIDNAVAGLVDFDPSTTSVTVATNNDKTDYTLTATNKAAIFEEVIEGTLTAASIMRICLSVLANKTTGGGTATLRSRDFADTKNRVTLTVDVDGNRSASTLDGS